MSSSPNDEPKTVSSCMRQVLSMGAGNLDCDEQVYWMEKIMHSPNDLNINDPLLFEFMLGFGNAICANARKRTPFQDECFIHFAEWVRSLKVNYDKRYHDSVDQLADDFFYDYAT